jgi:hypothetical protein
VQEITTNSFVPPHPLKTAVLFLIFNRPDTTKQVFEAIRKAKPPRLYIAADGPRSDKPGEAEKVEETRRIATQVDWDCEVKTLFREKNLGCRVGVSSGIDWFFENEEEGIILEDDCLPSQSFFWFCEELLERFRTDERIFIISGDNFQFGKRRTSESYYFSRYTHIWGWASWRRTWQKYDVEMKLWPTVRDGKWLYDILQDRKDVNYWQNIYERVFNNKIDTWDYQVNFSCWVNSSLNIIPNNNLVSNIGFGADSTHTADGNSPFFKIPHCELSFPLKHPTIMVRDALADGITKRDQFSTPFIVVRIVQKIRLVLVSVVRAMLRIVHKDSGALNNV